MLTVGLPLRGLAPGGLLFPGTILAAAAITVMNAIGMLQRWRAGPGTARWNASGRACPPGTAVVTDKGLSGQETEE